MIKELNYKDTDLGLRDTIYRGNANLNLVDKINELVRFANSQEPKTKTHEELFSHRNELCKCFSSEPKKECNHEWKNYGQGFLVCDKCNAISSGAFLEKDYPLVKSNPDSISRASLINKFSGHEDWSLNEIISLLDKEPGI